MGHASSKHSDAIDEMTAKTGGAHTPRLVFRPPLDDAQEGAGPGAADVWIDVALHGDHHSARTYVPWKTIRFERAWAAGDFGSAPNAALLQLAGAAAEGTGRKGKKGGPTYAYFGQGGVIFFRTKAPHEKIQLFRSLTSGPSPFPYALSDTRVYLPSDGAFASKRDWESAASMRRAAKEDAKDSPSLTDWETDIRWKDFSASGLPEQRVLFHEDEGCFQTLGDAMLFVCKSGQKKTE